MCGALIFQRLARAFDSDEFLRLLKARVDYGFELIRQDTEAQIKKTTPKASALLTLTQIT